MFALTCDQASGYSVISERFDTELPHQAVQLDSLGCPHELTTFGARPNLLLLRPKPDDYTSLSCWHPERRRQATYRVLFGRPLLQPTLSPAAAYSSAAFSHKIASSAQQPTEASKETPHSTSNPSRKRKPSKPKAPARTPKRICAAQAKQLAVEDEVCTVKEEKLSLIDQILFGDGSHEFTLADIEADFIDAEWLSMDSDAKSQLNGEDEEKASCLSLANTELLLEELESGGRASEQPSSILSLDFLKSLDEGEEDHQAAPGESSSPLDSSLLLDDLLGSSDSLDFAL